MKPVTNDFLQKLVDHEVSIYLVNGIKLTGDIHGVDEIGVVMSTGSQGGQQLVMRSAISSVVPTQGKK